ncbi:hypothetical protein RIF29_24387 [Crotalaria pallida]|uniref:Polygalacturonase n=1 Tax=Crotalaria pallida TaxID=3830 RepID=A0AAN9ELW5_CROPI
MNFATFYLFVEQIRIYKAFLKAWSAACGSTGILEVPAGKTFRLNPVKFSGPCKPTSLNFKLGGNIVAPQSIGAYGNNKDYWIIFTNVNGLVFNGGGQIDGQGSIWWKICKALLFNNCQYLKLIGTRHLNSARAHISITNSEHVTVSGLSISAPGNSPNTDGFDISDSSYLTIHQTNIGTGDDCIAMNRGTSNINIINVNCGPGHGISIGSLGKNGANEKVENVYVGYSSFNGTTNGVRIKTWQNGFGYVRNVTFEHITVINTQNPIIINQNYLDIPNVQDKNQSEAAQGGGLEITGVTYNDVRGTSATTVAINFDCSSSKGCNKILMDTISLTSFTSSSSGYGTTALCKNARGEAKSVSPEVSCLKKISH